MRSAVRFTMLLTLAAVTLVACEKGPKAPLYSCSGCDSTRYMVVFRDSVSDPSGLTDELARQYRFETATRYVNATMKGFVAPLEPRVVESIRHNPRVAYVRQGA